MRKYLLPTLICLVVLTVSSCGLIQPAAPQPQLSATDLPPKATALSELPPTWTPVPTFTSSPTIPPSPTPLPTQDPDNYQIGLVMTPVIVDYHVDPIDMSGWSKLEGQTAAMLIPPSYEVLDFAGVFIEMMFGIMEAFVEGFTDMALELGEEMGVTPQAEVETPDLGEPPEIDFLIALEEASQAAIILVSVEITPTTTTEDLINEALSDAEGDFKPISREEFLGGPFPMERVILDVEDDELGSGKQIIYVILGDESAWNVIFATPAVLFEEDLPLFESAIASFSEIK